MKVAATIDSDGHLVVFNLSDKVKVRKNLESIFKKYGTWNENNELQQAVRDLDWENIEFWLAESGFPQHGREIIVEIQELTLKNIQRLQ